MRKESGDHEVVDLKKVNPAVNPENSPISVGMGDAVLLSFTHGLVHKRRCILSTILFQSYCCLLTVSRCRLKVLLFNHPRRNREIFRCNAAECGLIV